MFSRSLRGTPALQLGMPRLDFVDLETARTAPGLRLVLVGILPSPWSEAAKGLFHAKRLPYRVVRFRNDDAALAAWTGTHNAPVVFYDDEPPRSGWKEIVELAERLDGELSFAPGGVDLLHDLAGEDGLGWCGRLVMMHTGFESGGARGFPLPVAKYLAHKYGYSPDRMPHARERITEILGRLDAMLASSGGDYLTGDRPAALDIYAASFLTMVVGVTEQECPALRPALRPALEALREEAGADVTDALRAFRMRVFERHLEWPIVL
ncbi:MAG: hypothetical protein H5U40_14760 [Polyangiaceae bacterium]|nr:hypothetical protein [Polyangiaceae bacterium]